MRFNARWYFWKFTYYLKLFSLLFKVKWPFLEDIFQNKWKAQKKVVWKQGSKTFKREISEYIHVENLSDRDFWGKFYCTESESTKWKLLYKSEHL